MQPISDIEVSASKCPPYALRGQSSLATQCPLLDILKPAPTTEKSSKRDKGTYRISIRTGISVNPCKNGLANRVGLPCGTIFQPRATISLINVAS